MLTAPTFEIIDDGNSRPDLAERQETKYVFNNPDLQKLRSVLRRTCRPIIYADPVSNVYSLYFDDQRLNACLANLDGVGLRHKTRLRWYDRPYLAGKSFFETKWRRNRVVGKRRLQLVSADLDQQISHRDLHKLLCRSIPAERLDYLKSDTDAVTLIQYQREHFALERTNIRITLDYNIRFYPQLGKRRLSLRFPERLHGLAVIECKSDIDEKNPLYQAIAALGARQDRMSKYVAACIHLGYATRI